MLKPKMFVTVIWFLGTVFWVLPAFAQVDTAWVKRYNGPGNSNDSACAIVVDGSGNVYVTGYSWDSGTDGDYATIKYYPNGGTAWVRRYNGPADLHDRASDIAIDGSGNVYVTGTSWGDWEQGDYATIKYDPNGDTAWVRRYNGPKDTTDAAVAIAVDSSSNVYVTGYSIGSGTAYDYATIKYYPNGDTAWVRRYNGPVAWARAQAQAIAVDAFGNVYVTGQSDGNDNSKDYATVKYDPDGIELWVRIYDPGEFYHAFAQGIAVDSLGDVYVTGGTITLFPVLDDENDFLTIKYHSNGDTAWVRRYNGSADFLDRGQAIALDASGNAYVTGFSYGSETAYDYATIKYDPNGDTAWVRRYNGPGNADDKANDITADNSGNVYVTGCSRQSGSSPYNDDYATVKYYPDGDTAWVRRYNGPGDDTDRAHAIAIDGSGNVYVTGCCYDNSTFFDYATIKYFDLSSPPEILDLCSKKGPNVNAVSLMITGCGFHTLAEVRLLRSGIPEDSIVGGDIAVVSYGEIISRFDLTGQPIGSVWDLVVTNPSGASDTLAAAFTIVGNDQLSPEDVLCALSGNRSRILDLQANARVASKFNGEPLDSIIHSVSLYKAPDKVKHVDYDNEDPTQVISTVINRGWMQYEKDPATGESFETNLLQEGQMTPEEFGGLNFYDPDAFLSQHYVSIENIYEYPDSLIFVLEAIPKRAEWTYSKLELEIDYGMGLIAKSTVYLDSLEHQSTAVVEQQFQDGIWVCTKLIKTSVDTSETLETEIELSNIQINVGIADSSFELPAGKTSTEETEADTSFRDLEVPTIPKSVSDAWDDPSVYKPNPLLFLHGFARGSPDSWETTMQKFREYMNPYYADDITWYVHCPNFQVEPGSNASIDGQDGWGWATCSEIEGRLTNFDSLPEHYRPQKVNVVAHSMGGLGARECVTGYSPFAEWVDKIITTGTPHLGSRFADIGRKIAVREKRAGLAVIFCPSWQISTGMEILAGGFLDIDLEGEAVEDMSIGSLFFDNLYARDQHEQEISYYAIAGVLFGFGDGVVSRKSQLGEGEPGGHDFSHCLQQPFGTAEIMAHHLNEPTKSFAAIRSFLDWRPSVLITSPQPDDEIVDACTLRIELHYEYLPAHTELFVTMTRIGDSPIADFQDFFRPDTSWRSQGINFMKSGRYDTTISISRAPAGKYIIEVKVRNPAGYEDEASVEITIGVDLMTQIAGGQARRGIDKVYGISYSNIGTTEASDVLLETILDPRTDYVSSTPPGNPVGNKVSWDISSLTAGEAGYVFVTAHIPWSVPPGAILHASASITSANEDVDTSNNTSWDREFVVGSYDPNDKVVNPEGIGISGYIQEGQTLRYTVCFENDSSATAEAINIVVVDTLDPDLDCNTLTFGPMSHPDKCSTSFDPIAGVITWECDSIMLPPNDNPPEGEGWVTFSIKPHYLPHGVQIRNRASIQFDNNPWIYAPMDSSYVVNTIDEYPPNSRVAPLWDTSASLDFEVSWCGSDDSLGFGSGIRYYTIYVSDDGAPYDVWIADTTDTSVTFHGELAHEYCFYSVAQDKVENIEEAPLAPDACIRTPNFIYGDTNYDGVVSAGDVICLINYLYRGQPLPSPLAAGDVNCNGKVSGEDVICLINYLFRDGSPPGCP